MIIVILLNLFIFHSKFFIGLLARLSVVFDTEDGFSINNLVKPEQLRNLSFSGSILAGLSIILNFTLKMKLLQ